MRYTFQHKIATGRTTFPVAVLISLALWVATYEDKTELISLLVGSLTTYLLIELNTTFALIRTRTELPSALYICLYSASLFLHPYQHSCWIQLAFVGLLFGLFYSYESKNSSPHIFHAFLCLGISSLFIPDLLWLVPLCYISMAALRSLSIRTFFAGVIGYCLPFWFYFGLQLSAEYILPEEFTQYLSGQFTDTFLANLAPLNITLEGFIAEYRALPLDKGVTYGITLLLAIIGSIFCIYYSQNDKVRTRSFLNALIPIHIGVTLLVFLHPSLIDAFLPVQAFYAALTWSYIFALVFNILTYYFLIGVLLLSGGIGIFNLWIHFFNF